MGDALKPLKPLTEYQQQEVSKFEDAADVFNASPGVNPVDKYESPRTHLGTKRYKKMFPPEQDNEKLAIIGVMDMAWRRVMAWMDQILKNEGLDTTNTNLHVVMKSSLEWRGIDVMLINSCMFFDEDYNHWRLPHSDVEKETVTMENIKAIFKLDLSEFCTFFKTPYLPGENFDEEDYLAKSKKKQKDSTKAQQEGTSAKPKLIPLTPKEFWQGNQIVRSLLCAYLIFDLRDHRFSNDEQDSIWREFLRISLKAQRLLELFMTMERHSDIVSDLDKLAPMCSRIAKVCKKYCRSFEDIRRE